MSRIEKSTVCFGLIIFLYSLARGWQFQASRAGTELSRDRGIAGKSTAGVLIHVGRRAPIGRFRGSYKAVAKT